MADAQVKPKVRINPQTQEAWSDTDITDFLKAYRYVICRAYGHAWNPPDGFYPAQVNGRNVHEKRVPCMRCPTQRVERIVITRNGVVDDSMAYIYPTGYQAEPGMALQRKDFKHTKHMRELVDQQERSNVTSIQAS